MIIIVCGLPGTGKTTLAKKIAKHFKGKYLNTDSVRMDLFPNGRNYSQNEKDRVYEELIKKAKKENKETEKVIVLDGTFYLKKYREFAKKELNMPIFVKCILEENIVEKRMREREISKKSKREDEGKSEANYNIHLKVKSQFEEFEEYEKKGGNYIEINTIKNKKDQLKEVLKRIKLNK